ncbi:MAG: DUF438 domain-containing protein [Anaerolineae bacterium]|nr:DUF438 domain-containing protein [Anaerolineae bacterium]MDW8102599.1 DUF438 domain-containing protein [Anaerolineae bacterium]
MSELFGKDRKEILKEIIRKIHQGANPEEVKAQFQTLLQNVSAMEIARAEEELIKEGLPREEVHRLCEVHLAVFREGLEKRGPTLAPPWHPIHILMEEHRILLENAAELVELAHKLGELGTLEPEIRDHLSHLAEHFRDSESHYVREENVLFPYIEKHGITEPPAIMWMEHQQIREVKKKLYQILERASAISFPQLVQELTSTAQSLQNWLTTHFHKENNILFPLSLQVIGQQEWADIRLQFDELGYCCFTPVEAMPAPVELKEPARLEGEIAFETGTLTYQELEAILNTLPIEITFVDKNDIVRYFNRAETRIFPRTRAVLGRTVQQCHPQKSIHVVNRIIEEFKAGVRDVAEFWINYRGRFLHIRYFPVRSPQGEYLGVLEVTQDITDIKRLEGEKRLLD